MELQEVMNDLYYQMGILSGMETFLEMDYSLENQLEKREVAHELIMEKDNGLDIIDLLYQKENEAKFYARIASYERLLSDVMNVSEKTVLESIGEPAGEVLAERDWLIFCAYICYYFQQVAEIEEGNERQISLAVNKYLKSSGKLKHCYLPIGKYVREMTEKQGTKGYQEQTEEYWIIQYLKAMLQAVRQENVFLRQIIELQRKENGRIEKIGKMKVLMKRLFRYISEFPVFDTKTIAEEMGVSFNTAQKAIHILEDEQIVSVMKGRQRYRVYCYTEYLNALKSL